MRMQGVGVVKTVAALGLLTASLYAQSPRPWWIPTQSTSPKSLAGGKLLVAARELGDPNFSETVILLLQYDKQGAMGLVVNHRTRITIGDALKEIKPAHGRLDQVYSGGPVETSSVFALMRASEKPEKDSHPVCGDIYLVTSKDVLEKSLAKNTGPSAFHLYLGYAGWGRGQLEREVEMGGWYIFPGLAGSVFDADPGSLWSRLIRQTDLGVAVLRRPSGGSAAFMSGTAGSPRFPRLPGW